MKNYLFAAGAIVTMASSAFASEGWSTDLPAALKQAAAEDKAVMVDFNGSDWCGPCIMLKTKVLSTPAFEAFAKDKFILVDIDMPKGDKITAEQKAKNKILVEQYAIKGYPTVLVMNKDGVVIGGFIGGRDDIAQVQADLMAALANLPLANKALEEAANLTGVGKAQALMQVYNLVPEGIRETNAALRAQILESDPSDVCGLIAADKAKLEKQEAQMAVIKLINETALEERAVVLAAELARTDIKAAHRMALEGMKLNLDLIACETAAELAAIRLAFIAYAEANPSEKDSVDGLLNSFLATEDEKILKYLEAMRQQQKEQAAKAAEKEAQ